MKKIFSIALAATLLAAGCQKTEVIGLDDSKTGPAMTFSTEMKKITKVAEDPTRDATLHTQGFYLWAYADFTEAQMENITNVDKESTDDHLLIYDNMYKMHVTHKEEGGWDTDKEYYWPGTEKYLRFYAVSSNKLVDPKNTSAYIDPFTSVSIDHKTDDALSSLAVKDFYVDVANPVGDLMVADIVKQEQTKKAVELTFHHALSKVEFLFNTTQSTEHIVYVQKVTIDGMEYKGTLKVTSALEQSSTSGGEATVSQTESTTNPIVADVDFDWDLAYADATEANKKETDLKSFEMTWEDENHTITFQEGTVVDWIKNTGTNNSVTYEYNKQYGMQLKYKQTVAEITPAFTWLMLPQSVDGKTVEIIYLINNRQFKAIFPLKKDSVEEWTDNQYIRYIVTLAPNLITFSASSTDWDNATDVNHQN
jgi:hypothetical protein